MRPKRTAKALGTSGRPLTTTSSSKTTAAFSTESGPPWSATISRIYPYRRHWCSCPHRLSGLEHIFTRKNIKKYPQLTMRCIFLDVWMVIYLTSLNDWIIFPKNELQSFECHHPCLALSVVYIKSRVRISFNGTLHALFIDNPLQTARNSNL